MSDDTRLERIEKKLDDMSEAIICLARMEERMITLFKRMDHYDEEQKTFRIQVSNLSETSASRGHALRFLERVWWIVLTTAVGTAFVYLKAL